MKNIYKMLMAVITVISAMLCSMYVQAAGNIQLVQVQTRDQNIFFYVRGIEEDVENVRCTIGNMESENVHVAKFKDLNASLCTYIMIDNSMSIPKKSREGIKKLLTELVAARTDNEKFAIATFGEEVDQIIGYTNDYVQLKDCISNIEFNNQDTYLTDMIYNVINSGALYCKEGDYVRILLIADGMDDDSVGYTEDELKSLLLSTHIPIYSLGVYNNEQTNNTTIEKMFALSRLTGGSGDIYDDIKSADNYNAMLAIDRDITVFDITPKAASLDGSEKTIRLSFLSQGEMVELVADRVRMGVKLTDTQETSQETETVSASETVIMPTVPETEKKTNFMLVPVAASALLVIVVVMILLLYRASKKKRKENVFKPIQNFNPTDEPTGEDWFSNEPLQVPEARKTQGDDYTMIIWGNEKAKGEEFTNIIWNNSSTENCVITLTDIAEPTRQYQGILKTLLLVGKSSDCNIVISWDSAISRKHFSIMLKDGLYYLKDEGSSNGTFVNESRIMAETQIKNGDIIRIGRTRLKFSVKLESPDNMQGNV